MDKTLNDLMNIVSRSRQIDEVGKTSSVKTPTNASIHNDDLLGKERTIETSPKLSNDDNAEMKKQTSNTSTKSTSTTKPATKKSTTKSTTKTATKSNTKQSTSKQTHTKAKSETKTTEKKSTTTSSTKTKSVSIAKKEDKYAELRSSLLNGVENTKISQQNQESNINPISETNQEIKSSMPFELDTGNKELDRKIAEFYRRKQEKINKNFTSEDKVNENEQIIVNESFEDEENLGINTSYSGENKNIYNLSNENTDITDYILTSNIPTDENEETTQVVESENVDKDALANSVVDKLLDEFNKIEEKLDKKPKEEMKVLYVASECQPFVASGGLGDVAGSLPKAIAKNGGVDIRVILPLYGTIKRDYRDKFEYLCNFTVHLSWRQEYCGLFRYYSDGVTYYFIDNERYFKRDKLYGYYDDGERFAYFSKAVVEALPYLNFFPDIIHCNDWQSALVSAYIKTGNWSDYRYYKIKNIYTIHNVEYQGVYGMDTLKDLFGIDNRFRNDVEYNGDINLTKSAIQYSDKFTTVSHSYCDNLKQPYCSRGLHHIIIRNEYKLSGILNGIDYDFYNPATDACLYKNYDINSIDDKVINKKRWQEEMGLPVDGETPMISIVSRLVNHKGIDLVIKVIENILQQDIQLVVVGTGDQKYVDYFRYLEGKYPTKVRALVNEYSNENARKAYGASDIFLMPSKIEPCGISQMIASRYGSIPVVREVGGLKDTIKDFGCEGGGNGYTFTNYNPNDLSYQLNRAIKDFRDRTSWREKIKTCMSVDFTWDKPAKDYIKLYSSVCGK
ncbi:MAG: glycogen synthase [Christensenellales bacterium]